LYNHNSTRVDLWSLTKRELQVWWYLVRGYSNKYISNKLTVEDKTIERHVNAIYSKLRVTHSVEKGQSPRTCLAWFAARDGYLASVGEDGTIIGTRNNMYNLDEREQLIVFLLRLGHSEESIADIAKINPQVIGWYIKLIAVKFGVNIIPSEDSSIGKKVLLERLQLV